MNKQRLVLGAGVFVFALLLGALLIVVETSSAETSSPETSPPVIPGVPRNALWLFAVALFISGPLIAIGFRKIPMPGGMLDVPLDIEPTVLSTPPKELSPEVERERRNYLSGREHQLPGFFSRRHSISWTRSWPSPLLPARTR